MSTSYQIVYWHDIPAQIIVRRGKQRESRQLSSRFSVAIDEAAMQAGKTSSADYLNAWQKGPWIEWVGDPEMSVDNIVAEVERAYSPERLRRLIRQGGVDQEIG